MGDNQSLLDTVLQKAKALWPELLEWRRHLHENPELSFQEYKTQAWLREKLGEMGIECHPVAETGLWGILKSEDAGEEEPVFWLRADMDALPIHENEEKPCVSHNPGVMHACGHDVHSACLLGALNILKQLRLSWHGKVGFVFQPGEEVLPGGASLVVSSGLFTSFSNLGMAALHVSPELDAGYLGFAEGPFMASSDEIYLTFEGPGGHGALPHLSADTLLAAASTLVILQQVASRRAPTATPTILSFGRCTAPGAPNVIPSKVELAGTFRTLDEAWRREAHQHIRRIAEQTAAAHSVSLTCEIRQGYPVLVNDPELTHHVRAAMASLFGAEKIVDLKPRMTSEDFSFYGSQMPVCLFRLGTGGPEHQYRHSVHTPRFDIHPEALFYGAAALAWAALSNLNAGRKP